MMIEIKGIITIIKAANEMGAKRVEIDADGSVAIEWPESNSVMISSPYIYIPPDRAEPKNTCPTCKYLSKANEDYPCSGCLVYTLWEPKEK